MVVELFLDLESQPCRAVFLFAKMNRIPFEMKPIDLMKGQHKTEEFLKVNPTGRVPALRDGDFALAESVAILLYLARKFRTPDAWYPTDPRLRARVDEFLSWQHTTIRTASCKIFCIKAFAPLLGLRLPPEKLAAAEKDLEKELRVFEGKFLQNRPFIAGDAVSLADLMGLEELLQVVAVGHDIFAPRPKMAAWRSRVEAAIGRELFQEAHEALFRPPGDPSANPPLAADTKEMLMEMFSAYVG